MLSYETAKKLKEAGFPQGVTEHQYGWVHAHNSFQLDEGDMTEAISAPTLEELISFCKKDYFILEYDGGYWTVGNGEYYQLKTLNHFKTPSEAVANLWLVLHSRK